MWNFGYEQELANEMIDNNKINNKLLGRISLAANKTWTHPFSQ